MATTKAKSTDSKVNTATKEDISKRKEMWKPNFKNIATTTQKYNPVVDVTSDKFEPIDTVFSVPGKNYRGRSTTLDPSPLNLVNSYWSLTIIETMKKHSNLYIKERKRLEPDLMVWKQASVSRDITVSCIYHFLAILYYFGIVRLPSKRDYWSTDQYMPQHKVCITLGMTRDRFEFMWRHSTAI